MLASPGHHRPLPRTTNGELVSGLNAGLGVNLDAETNLDAATRTVTESSTTGGNTIQ